ncbi:YeeE/YedE family protein [Robertkochia solimangrovi]|uniref:YeeE/YedE family protein n=1 Tax=Robertkochia solimangrovi TaxID=2213046 RepID=UPI00117D3D50|nr:YeeE/YedE thiosulfate transporter family protein [Robertkochia solimangrovi]TRZ43489.1 YeeE/YedE family protein [Robertkochia solimangrovi]
MDWIFNTWPWYVSGLMIAFIMVFLILMGKNFGVSANLRTLCTMCGADKNCEFFRFNWKDQRWNLLFLAGAVMGGFIAYHFLTPDPAVHIDPQVVTDLQQMGFESAGNAYAPDRFFGTEAFTNPITLLILAIGGMLVGFGARYAGGCTSGHAISGLSDLQVPSLIAVIGFFIGGLIMVHVIFPLIF